MVFSPTFIFRRISAVENGRKQFGATVIAAAYESNQIVARRIDQARIVAVLELIGQWPPHAGERLGAGLHRSRLIKSHILSQYISAPVCIIGALAHCDRSLHRNQIG